MLLIHSHRCDVLCVVSYRIASFIIVRLANRKSTKDV